jgi:hypothetical protein
MRILATAIAALAISTASAAWAQPVTEQIPPEKLALAHQLIAATGGEKQMEMMMDAMYGAMFRSMSPSVPPSQQALFKSLQQDMQAEMVKTIPTLLDASARIYAENLTDKELQDELAWLQSDSGQSIRRKTPVMMQEMVSVTIPIVQKMIPPMMKKVLDNVCEQQHCTAEQRKQMDAVIAKSMAKQDAAGS